MYSDKPYTEPHHLIPLVRQDQFDVSLNVKENIISLCSNCHNEIHYGKDSDRLIQELYVKYKNQVGYRLRQEYEHGKIKNESEFNEVLERVLSDCKEIR